MEQSATKGKKDSQLTKRAHKAGVMRFNEKGCAQQERTQQYCQRSNELNVTKNSVLQAGQVAPEHEIQQ
jgi:hypothetical protein